MFDFFFKFKEYFIIYNCRCDFDFKIVFKFVYVNFMFKFC